MSNRQMRRLHHLIKSSTGIDEEEPMDMNIDTMKPNVSLKGRRRKNEPQTEKRADTSAAPRKNSYDASDHLAPSTAAAATRRDAKENFHLTTACPSEDPKTSGRDEGLRLVSASVDAAPTDSASPGSRGGAEYPATGVAHLQGRNTKRKSKGSKKAKKDLEEDKLLEAVLRERDRAQGSTGNIPTLEPHQLESSLGVSMLVCAPEHLDMRLERIRNFGLEAVEDVGDGSTPLRPHGRLPENGSNSLFPEHYIKLSFRHSVFATPSRYRWPPFDSLGIRMVVASPNPMDAHSRRGTTSNNSNPNNTAPLVYQLDCDTSQFSQAEAARLACQALLGNPQDLINCLHRGPYHIPTLLQLYATFRALGNIVRANEMVDLALYHVGVLLSRFPIAETWCKRMVPCDCPENRILFQALQCGVHVALQRGCTRTAWEISRFVLSLDPRDPCGMLLLMDYLALRAKRWVWLVEVHETSLKLLDRFLPESNNTAGGEERREGATASGVEQPDPSLSPYRSDQIDLYLARRVLTLPSFAFSVALAKYFLERDLEQDQEASPAQGADANARNLAMRAGSRSKKQSKILRDITPDQRAMLVAAAPATAMLAQAIVRFPSAAVELVEKLQGVDAICKGAAVHPVWQDEVLGLAAGEAKQSANQGGATLLLLRQLNQFFVARHADLWKSAEPMKLLRSVLGPSEYRGGGESSGANAERTPTAPTPLVTALVGLSRSQCRYPKDEELARMYLALREEDIMGMCNNNAIPQELLGLDALDPDEAAMVRQLEEYESGSEIQEHPHQGDVRPSRGENPPPQRDNVLQLFMRTLFPWNNVDDVVQQQESQRAEEATSHVRGSDEENDWEDMEASSDDTSQND